MEPNDTHEIIAHYLHHTKPEHLKPGRDVGIAIMDEHTVIAHVLPLLTIAVITYQPGPDLFDVTISDATPKVREYAGVYCDQLGELIYGTGAGEFTLPLVEMFEMNPDGSAGKQVI